MIKILTILFILFGVISCSSISKNEFNATNAGKKILEISQSMIDKKEIIVGGCWDYINKVYERAGYSVDQRRTVFKSKFQGPYLSADLIEPGDWLYFVNHSFSDTEHSAIFVAWTDKERREALMVSYVGGKQKKPGLYKKFILDNIYNIIRARD